MRNLWEILFIKNDRWQKEVANLILLYTFLAVFGIAVISITLWELAKLLFAAVFRQH